MLLPPPRALLTEDGSPIGSLGPAVEGRRTLALGECSLEDADGSIERTEALLGAVLGGWGSMLKSTPPSKLLARPPVRCIWKFESNSQRLDVLEQTCLRVCVYYISNI